MVTPARPASGELIGRDQELTLLLDAVEAADDGHPSSILVGGDAGIGKTRLLSEMAIRSGARVLWGGCLPLGERGVPYLALIEMLRSLDESGRSSLPPAMAMLTPQAEDLSAERPISRVHLFQSVLEFFERLAHEDPLIVVVEDLHWADRSTRDLLDFLIGLLRDQKILVITSFRTDDLPNDHPLRAQLAEWLRRPWVTRLDLEPLTEDEGFRLIAPLLGGSVSRDQALRLVQRADGNPFFLEELAAGAPDLSGPPSQMRDLLLRRTRHISPELLLLLRVASVGGTSIDEDLLSAVSGLGADRIRHLLREGIEAQLLVTDDRSCRFRHALLAEALYDDLLPAERRDYHAAYAAALASGPGPIPAGELATHQAGADLPGPALASWVAAGEAAEAQFAFAEARDGYQAALDLWDKTEAPEHAAGMTRVDLLRRLAEAAFLAGDAEVACDTIRDVLTGIDPDTDPVEAGLAYHRLARYLRNTNEYGQALPLQERAVELIPAEPPSPERAEVLSGLALIHQFENRYHEARELSLEAIDVAVATGAQEAEIRARNTLGETVCVLEDLDQGLKIISEAYGLARQTGNAHEQARALWNMQGNRFFGGRMSDFVDNSGTTIDAFRITQPHWIVDHMVDTADALQMLGRWDEADAMLESARREQPTLASRIGIRELLIARGDLDTARALVEEQAQLLIGYMGPDVTGRVLNLVHQADIALAEGKPGDAIRLVEGALERYPALDKPVYICHGIAIGLRAAADLARSARMKQDAAALEGAVEEGERLHQAMMEKVGLPGPEDGWRLEVGCLAAQCDAELSRLHGKPDPEGWDLARDRWLALSMPYRAAYCRFRWAEDSLNAGVDRSEVARALEELSGFLHTLEARPRLDEVRALARRARIDLGDRYSADRYGLTERERDVLAELATGATNRQIAETLFISEKTASVHVSNILRKLDAANRGEAAAAAIREGLVDLTRL